MTPTSAHQLRDLILAEAHSRGVPLEQHILRSEQDLPVLRLRLAGKVLWGCRVGLPGDPKVSTYAPDVITVHGSGHRTSRMWPRKIDGSFNIVAVTDYLLSVVEQELLRPVPVLHLAGRATAAASGLHVVHLAGVRLGVLASRSKAADLMDRVENKKVQERMATHLLRGGLTDGDMRALGDAAGLYLGRANKLGDWDPLEPINDRIFTALVIGERSSNTVERRYVLILDHRGDKIDLADPAGTGLTVVTPSELSNAWKLGARQGTPWVGTMSAR